MVSAFASIFGDVDNFVLLHFQGATPHMSLDLDKWIQFGTFIISVFAFVVAWRKGGGEAKKLEADTVGSLSSTAMNLVHGIEERMKFIEGELEKERENIKVLSLELDTERRKRHELELRVDQLEDENNALKQIKSSLESENGHLKAQLKAAKGYDSL